MDELTARRLDQALAAAAAPGHLKVSDGRISHHYAWRTVAEACEIFDVDPAAPDAQVQVSAAFARHVAEVRPLVAGETMLSTDWIEGDWFHVHASVGRRNSRPVLRAVE